MPDGMTESMSYALAIAEVAWINILLSGDNAIVIALACRSLPPRERRWGIFLGSAVAIALRIIFAFLVTWLLAVPYLQAVGGVLLLWIAVSLLQGNGDDKDVQAHDSIWRAVATIAVADAAMSLDNVIAIAAIAGGDHWLFIIGLLLSIPLIVAGATMISGVMERYPIIVWAGSGLLGWVAGGMIADDAALHGHGMPDGAAAHYVVSAIAAVAVVLIGLWFKRRSEAASSST
jgi:YjbE family integral membrane protein